MKKILVILLLPLFAQAQTNLVPNPSFEEGECPDYNDVPLDYVEHWFNGTTISNSLTNCWYYKTCSLVPKYGVPENVNGYQYPRTGDAYVFGGQLRFLPGLHSSFYMSVELTEELLRDSLYYVGFWFSQQEMPESAGHKDLYRGFGVHLSENKLDTTKHLFTNYSPATTVIDTNCLDTLNYEDWILVADTFKASGEEKFYTIGSFLDTITMETLIVHNTTYNGISYSRIYVDDAFVIPLFETQTDTTSSIQMLQKPRQLLRIIDMLGRETQAKPNTPLFYMYTDGTVEKRVVVE